MRKLKGLRNLVRKENVMKKVILFVIVIVAMVFALFGGVSPVSVGNTLHGMRSAVQGGQGTFIMADQASRTVMLAWQNGLSYNFVALNAANSQPVSNFMQIATNGNRVDVRSFSELVRCLEGNGWRYIAPSALPTGLVADLVGVQAWFVGFKWAMPTVLVLPMVLQTPPADFLPVHVDG
jgi:hypothetical protein